MSKNSTREDTIFRLNRIPYAINPNLVIGILFAAIALLAMINLISQYLYYYLDSQNIKSWISLVDMDAELNIPSIFSVIMLFLSSLLLAVITILKKQEEAAHQTEWIILTLGFTLMTYDEGASIHEDLMTPVSNLMGDGLPGIFYFTWVIPALAIVVILAFLFLRFLKDLPTQTRKGILVSAIIYLGGAVGFELIGGNYADLYGLDNFGFNVLATFEESLEMCGVSIFIHTLLIYLGKYYSNLRIQIGDK